MTATLKLIAFPKTDSQYTTKLYSAMSRHQADIRFAGSLTRSWSCNYLLLPFELTWRRSRGYRIVHLHWVFTFVPPWARGRLRRAIGLVLFKIFLEAVRLLGLHLVWTVHNVLPHEQVFPDDLEARRMLAATSSLLVFHSAEAQRTCEERLNLKRPSVIIPHGPITLESSEMKSQRSTHRQLLFFGRIMSYKGVDHLANVFADLKLDAHLMIMGEAGDAEIQSRLREAETRSGGRIKLMLRHFTDDELAAHLSKADAVILPFREITTSGSALTALANGKTVVIPDLPALREIPTSVAIKYDPTKQDSIASALERVTSLPVDLLDAMGEEGRKFALSRSWDDAAYQLTAIFRSLAINGHCSDRAYEQSG